MAKLVDKMFNRVIKGPLDAKEEIVSAVNQGIKSGEISGEKYILTGYFIDQDGNIYGLNTEIYGYVGEQYTTYALSPSKNESYLIVIDFVNLTIKDADNETYFSLDTVYIMLSNMTNGNVKYTFSL